MSRQTIIKSIHEASRLNPEPSRILERKLDIHIGVVMMKHCDMSSRSYQTITSNDGTVYQYNINSSCSCSKDIEYLKKENEQLKSALKDKDQIISLLKKQ